MSGVAVNGGPRLGFHGKIPLASDFVSRRLPRSFVTAWDGWLQQSILGSQQSLGDSWLDTYLTSPVWRFALAPGTCGPEAFAGVLVPSVDKVGRYFPFGLIAMLPASTSVVRLLSGDLTWFEQVESLALAVLEQDIDVDRLETQIQAIPPLDTAEATVDRGILWSGTMRLALPASPASLYPDMLDGALRAAGQGYSLWWTVRCEGEPSLLSCQGLPAPGAFAALLDGSWEGRGWTGLARAAAADGVPQQPAEQD